jgi:hypothetical protein
MDSLEIEAGVQVVDPLPVVGNKSEARPNTSGSVSSATIEYSEK